METAQAVEVSVLSEQGQGRRRAHASSLCQLIVNTKPGSQADTDLQHPHIN